MEFDIIATLVAFGLIALFVVGMYKCVKGDSDD